MSQVYIVGNKGNMARRYEACLNWLGHTVVGHDKGEELDPEVAWSSDAFIIATPTEHHFRDICAVGSFGKPMLCEKPISKNIDAVTSLFSKYAELSMVNQYSFLLRGAGDQDQLPTFYDYFKSGGDGLNWDCINIVGLAKGDVTLSNKSPFWTCLINGQHLHLSDMDKAYVEMLEFWLRTGHSNADYALAAHRKVIEMEKECKTS